jgi:hypothetical protein
VLLHPQVEEVIVTQIHSGLGNQMFRFAAGYALAKRANLQFGVDTSWFRRSNADQSLLLHHWNLILREAQPPENIVREMRRVFFQELPLEPAYLVGHWQSERYFLDAREELLRMFTPPDLLDRLSEGLTPIDYAVEKIVNAQNAKTFDVAIHVRRKGRRGTRFWDIANEAYYRKAIGVFLCAMPEATFGVWGDDQDWVKQHLPKWVEVQPTGHPVHDLVAMSRCKHQIIANSSYSWWAAWLNQNPDKRIVWPEMLAHDFPPVAETDYIPDSWQHPWKSV